MSTNSPGWSRRGASADGPALVAQNAAAAALIDLDTRQSYVTEAVTAVAELSPSPRLSTTWRPVADQAFTASSAYLDATHQFPAPSPGDAAAAAAFGRALSLMGAAAQAIDDFYQDNRRELERARSALAAVPRIVQDARVAAERATEIAAAGRPEYLEYPSVIAALDALSSAMSSLDRAGAALDRRHAAAAVTSAAAAIEQAIAAAPGRQTAARSALSSVRTRLDGINGRFDQVDAARSALLREFNAASSLDVVDSRRLAETEWTTAGQAHRRAVELFDGGQPEAALTQLAVAREHAGRAEAAVDTVLSRLARLRQVRGDPQALEKTVRFRIRDAQRLVLDAGLVREWGSVLDAQAARLDRALARLTGVHPDYWALIHESDAIVEFVADTVEKVRGQVRSR